MQLRIVSGHHVVLVHSDIEEIKQQKEYQVATEIAADVENYYHVKFPQQEIAYIAMHLLGTKLLSQTKSQVDHVINDEILHLVHFVLEKTEEQLELGIQNDQELILGLSLHLKPAVNRIKFGMNIRNPMLQDIKNNYPLAYEAGIIAGIAVKEYTGIEMDENEIGYLALHFGAAIERKKLQSGPKRCLVVCASGLGTSQLIFYRLKSYFGHNLEVVGTTEYYKLKQMNLNGIDFIVSSIPIQESFHIPVIEVNAVLKEQDLKSIEKFIVNQNTSQPILSYFHKDLTFLKEKLATQEKALEFLNDVLLDKGLVDDTFLEAIYEREKVAPTAFGNLVAIPHPITPKTKKTFVVVCTLVKPIIWSETPVQIIFLLCVKKDSQEDLQEMYDLLGKFIENKAMVQNILKAKTYEDFIHVIRE
ncbi:MAG: PRD domain-containing protein [Caldibacillus thermoamylovorans]